MAVDQGGGAHAWSPTMSVIPKRDGERVYRTYEKRSEGPWDVIVVGSGMGGMACACALARYGRKVLMLEQHYLPGGYTHMFGRRGWVWDVGVHAVGEMAEDDLPGKMLRWLAGDQLEMTSLGNPYDRFRFHDGFTVEFPDTKAQFIANLKEAFPEQSEGIDRYIKAVDRASKAAMKFFAFKSLPRWVHATGDWFSDTFGRDWWKITTAELLDEVGIEGKLRTVLTVHWGYIGSTPSESSFACHALTHTHFWNGAFYPRGGSKAFAQHLLAPVLDAGGEVLVNAEAEEILVEEGVAVGVRMADGEELRARRVVSAAGAKTTVNRLLPEPYRSSPWANAIRGVEDSPSYICLNLGFKGDLPAAGGTPANLWLYSTWDNEDKLWHIEDPTTRAPILYCSFPSLKDPDHDPGPEQRHTGECVTFVPWDVFERWDGSRFKSRDEAYEAFKESVIARLVAHLRERIPDIMALCEHVELSTPLSSKHFVRASHGAIYGLAATPARFKTRELRSRTPIKRFYLSGIDIASLGVVGAMTTGMLTAATIEPRVYLKML